jgi:5-methylcytosine-specific restriction endonuclease McrA
MVALLLDRVCYTVDEIEHIIRKGVSAMSQCVHCGWSNEVDLQVDHVIPQSLGGPTLPFNLVWACKWCNEQKGVRTGDEYVMWRNRNPLLATHGPLRGWEVMSRPVRHFPLE